MAMATRVKTEAFPPSQVKAASANSTHNIPPDNPSGRVKLFLGMMFAM